MLIKFGTLQLKTLSTTSRCGTLLYATCSTAMHQILPTSSHFCRRYCVVCKTRNSTSNISLGPDANRLMATKTWLLVLKKIKTVWPCHSKFFAVVNKIWKKVISASDSSSTKAAQSVYENPARGIEDLKQLLIYVCVGRNEAVLVTDNAFEVVAKDFVREYFSSSSWFG